MPLESPLKESLRRYIIGYRRLRNGPFRNTRIIGIREEGIYMDHEAVARKMVESSVVLLKNDDGLLPFGKGQRAAFFGRTQIGTIFSGNGSGASRKAVCKSILDECEQRGICPHPLLASFYREKHGEERRNSGPDFDMEKIKEAVNSGLMYEIFGRYSAPAEEYAISGELLEAAAAYTDTAVLVIGRNSGGEECDRHLHGDYYLTDSEKTLVEQVCGCFAKVVLILNVNGLIELSFALQYPSVKSILFAGIPGEEGASALAEILTGEVSPSGKLAFTIAKEYGDYPSADCFTWDKENEAELRTYETYGLSAAENGSVGFVKSPVTLYREDIYSGYRYFDTFSVEPLYAFGYGMSYTDFALECNGAEKKERGVEVTVSVRNTGAAAGREVVQLYVAGAGQRPYQELKGFEKTGLLQPKEQQELKITVSFDAFSRYDEARAAYVIVPGTYAIRFGNSSRSTEIAAAVEFAEEIVVEQCSNRLGIKPCNRDRLSFLTAPAQANVPAGQDAAAVIGVSASDVAAAEKREARPEKNTDRVRGLSAEQLAALCVGYGPGTPFAALGDGSDPETIFDENQNPLTTNSHPTGHNGYVSPAIESEGIASVFYKDGPAGIGEVAWPTQMLAACAFDREIWYAFGNAVGAECEKQQVDVWLAPAVNLQRHPLGGRNFEYFSEDPYLTGICACEITRGVQENHPVIVCPKHFAVNEQETFRRGSGKKQYDAVDSIISERAARELYLKPFEMLVKNAGVLCMMTSFNKINGTFAAGNADLCTHILRDEWGYEGFVVTDWGDMDVVVDGADAVAAGNDIVMPGGPPVIAQILDGYRKGSLTRAAMELAVCRLLDTAERIGQPENR